MTLLDEIRSMREGLDRIEAGLIERHGIPAAASSSESEERRYTSTEWAIRARWQALADQTEYRALMTEANTLRMQVTAYKDMTTGLEGVIKSMRARHDADIEVMHKRLEIAYREPTS